MGAGQDSDARMRSVANMISELEHDPWRASVGFSEDMKTALECTIDPNSADDLIIEMLNRRLEQYQPCLFGRIAAKRKTLTFCLLREADLLSDDLIAQKNQQARLGWRRLGFEGRSSGFIIVVLSRNLVTAAPSSVVRDIALRICTLYLEQPAKVDEILWDRLYLEQPGNKRTTWEWITGVNYFSAQADKRWWQDHRIPAGMAFSVNSVGHLAKSGKMAVNFRAFEEAMDTEDEDWEKQSVDSLEKALVLAMRTISLASSGPSGKATYLLPAPDDPEGLPSCPIRLDPPLDKQDYCMYGGLYHTDITIPSEYFRAEVTRPSGLSTHDLDLTYLFDRSPANADYILMGSGQRIRDNQGPLGRHLGAKRNRAFENGGGPC